jgi:hypothetical protein
MKSFREWLLEATNINDVHHNTTATTLKRIAKHGDRTSSNPSNRSHIGRARYVIDKAGSLHGGNSYHHTHASMIPVKDHHTTGEVIHNHKTNTTYNRVYTGDKEHPHIKAMSGAGVTLKDDQT